MSEKDPWVNRVDWLGLALEIGIAALILASFAKCIYEGWKP